MKIGILIAELVPYGAEKTDRQKNLLLLEEKYY